MTVTGKFGGCFVIGFQNLSQIEEIYNPTVAKVITDLAVSKLIFETVDPGNARRFSEMLGEKEVLESTEQVSFGANEIRDGVSLSHQKKFQPLVRAVDIMQLKPLSCFAKIANVDVVFHYGFSYLDLPIVANDFEGKGAIDLNQKIKKNEDVHQKVMSEDVGNEYCNIKTISPIFEYKFL